MEAMTSSEESYVLRKAVEFGFHPVHSDKMKVFEDGLLAERKNPCADFAYGVTYGHKILTGTTEFEIEIASYGSRNIIPWSGSLYLGVMQHKAGNKIKLNDIPRYSFRAKCYCMFGSCLLSNRLIGYSGPERKEYGSINLDDLRKGDRVGMRVSHDGVLIFFVNGESQGVAARDVYQKGFDVYAVVDVFGECTAVKITRAVQKTSSSAIPQDQMLKDEVAFLKQQDQMLRDQVVLLEQQLKVFQEDFEAEWRDRKRMSKEKDAAKLQYESRIACLEQERDSCRNELAKYKNQAAQQLAERDSQLAEKDSQLAEKDSQLAEKDSQLQTAQAEIHEKDQSIIRILSENEGLRQQVSTLSEQIRRIPSQLQPQPSSQSEFWEVPREEISLNMQKILGTGAWGFVVEGKFRGQLVAVKCLHDMIREPEVIEIIRKEICIMAQIRHPNLVMLIAAVIDMENDPLVVTELLDISLRKAYEKSLLEGSSKLNIFRDIASALNYLHLHHRGEIIHRDVSSANVLLEAKPSNQWKAKLSDFGSAKLAIEAKTTGPGAPVYAAPEVRREMGFRQTGKVDVYSYGILLCEVTVEQFPMEKRLPSMLQVVQGKWTFMHHLITTCIQEYPDNRPTMSYVLAELDKLQTM